MRPARHDVDDELEPEESDLTTEDHVHFYQDGKLALTIQKYVPSGGRALRDGEGGTWSDAEGPVSTGSMWRQLDAFMERERFWPNVWFISDHGNAHLMTRPQSRGRRKGAKS